jgi:acyl carrier protein
MTDQELTTLVTETLFSVAPDLEGETVEPDATFRAQFEIDSMDFLNFIIALSRKTGLEIPEADYPGLETLSGAVAYLKAHAAGAG